MSNQLSVSTPATVRRGALKGSAKVEKLTPHIGAEISNIDLAVAAEDASLMSEVRQLLLAHKVLFFRNQQISASQHVKFAKCFGELETHPTFRQHPDHPELAWLRRDQTNASRENIYHADCTWRAEPSMGAVLRCVECPEVGGDTIWVNMARAYDQLPASVKNTLQGLTAMHDISHSIGGSASPEERMDLRRKFPAQEHPVVVEHEETGEKILYVNQGFTSHFANFQTKAPHRVGSDFAVEANALMQYLFRQAEAAEYQVRLRWAKDTVAVWDNRVTQHYAIQDYYPAVRSVQRAAIVGTKPKAPKA